jgi:hypothetical protein
MLLSQCLNSITGVAPPFLIAPSYDNNPFVHLRSRMAKSYLRLGEHCITTRRIGKEKGAQALPGEPCAPGLASLSLYRLPRLHAPHAAGHIRRLHR